MVVSLQEENAVVIDHINNADLAADHTVIAASDLIKSKAILGPKRIEVRRISQKQSRVLCKAPKMSYFCPTLLSSVLHNKRDSKFV
jgi:hypothetical protein